MKTGILFISYKFPPGVGGMQKQSFELINGMTLSGDFDCYSITKSKQQHVVWFFILLFFKVPRLLNKHPHIQLIHCNDGICALICSWMKWFLNVKVAMTYHGLDLVFPNKIYQSFLLPLVRTLDGFICVSDFTAKECLKRGFNPCKVYVVPNGVDNAFGLDHSQVQDYVRREIKKLQSQGKKILVSIGRPVKRKGFSKFIKTTLSQLEDSFHYIIIGPYTAKSLSFLCWLPSEWRHHIELFLGAPSDAKDLSRLSLDTHMSKRFTWFKSLNYESLKYVLRMADVYVMPNQHVKGDAEGFGLVALESVMSGTVVYASEIEGITTAIKDQSNGFLLNPNNAAVWIKALRSHFKLPKSERLNLTETHKTYTVENFSWLKMIQGYSKVFNSTLAYQVPQPQFINQTKPLEI